MKKIATIAAVALFAIAFTSCKKDYKCECVSKENGTVLMTQTIELKDQKKKDAETACSGKATASSGGVTVTTECNLK